MKTLSSIAAFAATLVCLALPVEAGTITTTTITAETDIVNTNGALVSAANFGEAAVVINGLSHGAGSGAGANLTDNFTFEGDFRNGQSGLGGNLETLLSGIAGSSSITMSIGGLSIGQKYLFQGYWETRNWVPGTQTLQADFEGDSLSGITGAANVLISYEWIATDSTLNMVFDRDDALGGDGNNWLSGYSLQAIVPSPAALPAGLMLLGLAAMRRRTN